MKIEFSKYTGAGNDFVILDNREKWFDWNNKKLIARLCDRKFGVGADGILLLQNKKGYTFEMLYANSDGSRGSMCGNGGRCLAMFAHHIGLFPKNKVITFLGPDGKHEAEVLNNKEVRLKMIDIKNTSEKNGLDFVFSGAPHHIQFVTNLESFPVVAEARKLRDRAKEEDGISVNYVEKQKNGWGVRTYELGVEDETLACGTGAVAVTIALADHNKITKNECAIHMPGGVLQISFEKGPHRKGYKNIWLRGPAQKIFTGTLTI